MVGSGFNTRQVSMRFVVVIVALGQISLPVLQFSPVSIIPPLLHTHYFNYDRRHKILAIDSSHKRQLPKMKLSKFFGHN